jgi:hypothetical protein
MLVSLYQLENRLIDKKLKKHFFQKVIHFQQIMKFIKLKQ